MRSTLRAVTLTGTISGGTEPHTHARGKKRGPRRSARIDDGREPSTIDHYTFGLLTRGREARARAGSGCAPGPARWAALATRLSSPRCRARRSLWLSLVTPSSSMGDAERSVWCRCKAVAAPRCQRAGPQAAARATARCAFALSGHYERNVGPSTRPGRWWPGGCCARPPALDGAIVPYVYYVR